MATARHRRFDKYLSRGLKRVQYRMWIVYYLIFLAEDQFQSVLRVEKIGVLKMKLRPSEMFFTEDYVSDIPDTHSPSPEIRLTKGLADFHRGQQPFIDGIPLLPVMLHQGQFWCLENRWLWVLQQIETTTMAGEEEDLHVPVCIVPCPDDFAVPPVHGGEAAELTNCDPSGETEQVYNPNPIGWNVDGVDGGDPGSRSPPGAESSPVLPSNINQGPIKTRFTLRRRSSPQKSKDGSEDLSEVTDCEDSDDGPADSDHRIEIIDNSGFETFCFRAGLAYMSVIVILVLTYGR